MPDVIVPLMQLPEDAGTEADRPHVPRYNDDLRQAHNQLVRATTRHVRHESATVLDEPGHLAHREDAKDLDDELPTAIHEYAATAIFAFDILTRGSSDAQP